MKPISPRGAEALKRYVATSDTIGVLDPKGAVEYARNAKQDLRDTVGGTVGESIYSIPILVAGGALGTTIGARVGKAFYRRAAKELSARPVRRGLFSRLAGGVDSVGDSAIKRLLEAGYVGAGGIGGGILGASAGAEYLKRRKRRRFAEARYRR